MATASAWGFLQLDDSAVRDAHQVKEMNMPALQLRSPATAGFRIEPQGPELRSFGAYGAGETRCLADPRAAPLVSAYAAPSIGVVVTGAFDYRSPIGALTASPGTILLGNTGEDFSYAYLKAGAVRRSVVALSADLVSGVAEEEGVDPTFSVAGLPHTRDLVGLYGLIRRMAGGHAIPADRLVEVAGAALTAGQTNPSRPVSAEEAIQVRDLARQLDAAFSDPWDLDEMAERARMARYRFIRVFQREMGENPRRYLVAARLRAAADRLLETQETVTAVALEVGFNDISHFNATFRDAFKMSPQIWRGRA